MSLDFFIKNFVQLKKKYYLCTKMIGYFGREARQWSATPSTAVRIRQVPQLEL